MRVDLGTLKIRRAEQLILFEFYQGDIKDSTEIMKPRENKRGNENLVASKDCYITLKTFSWEKKTSEIEDNAVAV